MLVKKFNPLINLKKDNILLNIQEILKYYSSIFNKEEYERKQPTEKYCNFYCLNINGERNKELDKLISSKGSDQELDEFFLKEINEGRAVKTRIMLNNYSRQNIIDSDEYYYSLSSCSYFYNYFKILEGYESIFNELSPPATAKKKGLQEYKTVKTFACRTFSLISESFSGKAREKGKKFLILLLKEQESPSYSREMLILSTDSITDREDYIFWKYKEMLRAIKEKLDELLITKEEKEKYFNFIIQVISAEIIYFIIEETNNIT